MDGASGRHQNTVVMSAFGETLFSGSRFIQWALSPFILIFAVNLPELAAVLAGFFRDHSG